MIPTPVLGEIRKKANEQNISMAEWCRRKLRGDDQLDGIEEKLDNVVTSGNPILLKKLENL